MNIDKIAAKRPCDWTREEYYAVKDYLDGVPDRKMSGFDVNLLFLAGDAEEALIAADEARRAEGAAGWSTSP